MYKFRFVIKLKIFIFLCLPCLSFFVASGGSKKKMSLEEMKNKVALIKERLEKENSLCEHIVKNKKPNLELLILHAEKSCLKEKELNLLYLLNSESSTEEFVDFSKFNNDEDKSNDENIANSEKSPTISEKDKNQLWRILNGYDYSFCEKNVEDRRSIDTNTDSNGTIASVATNENNINITNIMESCSSLLSKIYPGKDDGALEIRTINKEIFLRKLLVSQKQKIVNREEYDNLVKMYRAVIFSRSTKFQQIVRPSIFAFGEFKGSISDELENKLLSQEVKKYGGGVKSFFSKLFGCNNISSIGTLPTASLESRMVELGDYLYFWFVEEITTGKYRKLLLMSDKSGDFKGGYSFEDVYKICSVNILREYSDLLDIKEEEEEEIEELMKMKGLGQLSEGCLSTLEYSINEIQKELAKEEENKEILKMPDWCWKLVIKKKSKKSKKGKKVEEGGLIDWIACDGDVKFTIRNEIKMDCSFSATKNNETVSKKLLLPKNEPYCDDNEEIYKDISDIAVFLYKLDRDGKKKDEKVFDIESRPKKSFKISFRNKVGRASACFYLNNGKYSYNINKNNCKSFTWERIDAMKKENFELTEIDVADSAEVEENSKNRNKNLNSTAVFSAETIKKRVLIKEKEMNCVMKLKHLVQIIEKLEYERLYVGDLNNNNYIALAKKMYKEKKTKEEIRKDLSFCFGITDTLLKELTEVEKSLDNSTNNKTLTSLKKEKGQPGTDTHNSSQEGVKNKAVTETILSSEKLRKVKEKLFEQHSLLNNCNFGSNDGIEKSSDLGSSDYSNKDKGSSYNDELGSLGLSRMNSLHVGGVQSKGAQVCVPFLTNEIEGNSEHKYAISESIGAKKFSINDDSNVGDDENSGSDFYTEQRRVVNPNSSIRSKKKCKYRKKLGVNKFSRNTYSRDEVEGDSGCKYAISESIGAKKFSINDDSNVGDDENSGSDFYTERRPVVNPNSPIRSKKKCKYRGKLGVNKCSRNTCSRDKATKSGSDASHNNTWEASPPASEKLTVPNENVGQGSSSQRIPISVKRTKCKHKKKRDGNRGSSGNFSKPSSTVLEKFTESVSCESNEQDSSSHVIPVSGEKNRDIPVGERKNDSSSNYMEQSPIVLEQPLGYESSEWRNNIFSSVIFFYFGIAFALLFFSVSIYDFYSIWTQVSAQEDKKKKKGKRKKLSLLRMIIISLDKTISRFFLSLSSPKSEKEKVKNKKERKKRTSRVKKIKTNRGRKIRINRKGRLS